MNPAQWQIAYISLCLLNDASFLAQANALSRAFHEVRDWLGGNVASYLGTGKVK